MSAHFPCLRPHRLIVSMPQASPSLTWSSSLCDMQLRGGGGKNKQCQFGGNLPLPEAKKDPGAQQQQKKKQTKKKARKRKRRWHGGTSSRAFSRPVDNCRWLSLTTTLHKGSQCAENVNALCVQSFKFTAVAPHVLILLLICDHLLCATLGRTPFP